MSQWYCAVKGWVAENKIFVIGTLITSALLQMHMVAYHPDPHLKEAMDAVTIIHTPEGTGSGFFIDDHCMLTASHVVTNSSGTVLPVQFRMHGDLRTYDGVVVNANPWLDIAMICSSTTVKNYLTISDTEHIQRGEKVYALGDTAGRVWNLTDGIVSRMGYKSHGVESPGDTAMTVRYNMWVTAFISWGNSGGPVIDSHGNVVGMIIEWDDPAHADHPNGMNVAVPGTDLLRFIRTTYGD